MHDTRNSTWHSELQLLDLKVTSHALSMLPLIGPHNFGLQLKGRRKTKKKDIFLPARLCKKLVQLHFQPHGERKRKTNEKRTEVRRQKWKVWLVMLYPPCKFQRDRGVQRHCLVCCWKSHPLLLSFEPTLMWNTHTYIFFIFVHYPGSYFNVNIWTNSLIYPNLKAPKQQNGPNCLTFLVEWGYSKYLAKVDIWTHTSLQTKRRKPKKL